MPAGRPTKYDKGILEKANAYLENYEAEHQHAIPSVAGLALVLDIRRETLHVWAKEDGASGR